MDIAEQGGRKSGRPAFAAETRVGFAGLCLAVSSGFFSILKISFRAGSFPQPVFFLSYLWRILKNFIILN